MKKHNPHLQAGVGYPVCKGLQAIYNPNGYYISERELQLPAQIPRYLRIFYHDIHRPSSASKTTKHEMSFWLRHKSVICFKEKAFIKKTDWSLEKLPTRNRENLCIITCAPILIKNELRAQILVPHDNYLKSI